LFLHFNPWNLIKNNTNTNKRTEQRRFGRAWTTLRVRDSMRRISYTTYTSRRPIHFTESYSKNSIGEPPFTVCCCSYLLQGLITFLIQIPAPRTRCSGRAGARRSRVCSWDTKTFSEPFAAFSRHFWCVPFFLYLFTSYNDDCRFFCSFLSLVT